MWRGLSPGRLPSTCVDYASTQASTLASTHAVDLRQPTSTPLVDASMCVGVDLRLPASTGVYRRRPASTVYQRRPLTVGRGAPTCVRTACLCLGAAYVCVWPGVCGLCGGRRGASVRLLNFWQTSGLGWALAHSLALSRPLLQTAQAMAGPAARASRHATAVLDQEMRYDAGHMGRNVYN